MRNALSLLLLTGALSLVGCNSGSSETDPDVRIRCLGGQSFCIISCDLGCSQTGCSVTQIAENQRLRFKFSNRVDPASVNGATISIRTATGVAPDGELLVVDNQVTFVPSVSVENGVSTFGFLRNESYILTLAGGPGVTQTVRDLSGDGLSGEFSCTVVASRGVIDEDQQAPTVELISPTNLTAAPVNPTIVLRFSELIDTSPLQASLGEASPIRVFLRPTLAGGDCDRDAAGIALSGVPTLSTEQVGGREVTVVTFQPQSQLPGNSCIGVEVTADLRDLSGRQAVPARFEFLTIAGTSVPFTIVETFSNAAGQEPLTSGGRWNNGARPGLIGGDGRHGSFNPALGTPIGSGAFEWNVDNFLIPAASSATGLEYVVTDGRFFFTDFVLPANTRVRFVGSVPPVISVRGQMQIDGILELNGRDQPFVVANGVNTSTFNARLGTGIANGGPATTGGCGAGSGGVGGRESGNTGPVIVNGVNITNGQPGQDVRLAAGHAYAGSASGTGGRGGLMTPASGIMPTFTTTNPALVASIYFPFFSTGGSGGGHSLAGGTPVIVTAPPQVVSEPAAAPGASFPLLPFPATPPTGYTSVDHFLVGGSGGGGGGSHGYGLLALGTPAERWMAGHGGTGGGGAIALRAGGDVTIGVDARVIARGGDGPVINGDDPNTTTLDSNFGISSPGGGGSGGSVLIQSGQDISCVGQLDLRGGLGGRVQPPIAPANVAITARGGDGSPGYFRLEAGGIAAFGGTSTPIFNAANNTGPLNDRDSRSGDVSTWRSSGLIFPPSWLRYELDVDTNGDGTVDITYTDSGAPGTSLADDPNGPVVIEFQGADLNQITGEPIPGSEGPWRVGVGSNGGPGLNLDSVTAFRFRLLYNPEQFPNLIVRALRVFAQS